MKAILALEDGTWFAGHSFTGAGEVHGEVIFQTSMSGYQGILADPAYAGQMVCLTAPLVGNYGVTLAEVESSRLFCPALIVKECCQQPSNWQAKESLPDYLSRHGVMGLEGIDTRALTKHLRVHGNMRGVISTQNLSMDDLVLQAKALPSRCGTNLVFKVAPENPYVWTTNGPEPAAMDGTLPLWPAGQGMRVVVYDFGTHWETLRLLSALGLTILVVPPLFPLSLVKALAPQGIFLSSGPGDPATVPEALPLIRELCSLYPMAGLGLGYQLLGLALGGKSYKLKVGHYGSNYPVQELLSGKIEISTQNHGFALDISPVKDLQATHIHIHDQSLEGFQHRKLPILGMQYLSGADVSDQGSLVCRFTNMLVSHHSH